MAALSNFYSNLYKEKKVEEDKIEEYFNKIKLKKLTQEEKNLLEEPITQEEIIKAIDLTKLGKPQAQMAILQNFIKSSKKN